MDDKTKLLFTECAHRICPDNAELKLAIQAGDKDAMYHALKKYPTKNIWDFFKLAEQIEHELAEV